MSENEDQQQPKSPLDFLKSIQGAPSKNEIDAWKMQAPGGRIQLFCPDGSAKRVFIIRALSGLELESISKQIPENSTNRELEMQIHSCVKACVWTNCTGDGMVDEMFYRKSPAGLCTSMWQLVSKLSDFIDPETLEMLSADL